jgi:hypothetical protein
MKKLLGLFLALLITFSFSDSSYATPNTTTNTTPNTTTTTNDVADDDDDDMEWGWIGLLGLFGLLGLRKKEREVIK